MEFRVATLNDLDLLTTSRIEVLKAANKLDPSTDMANVEYDFVAKQLYQVKDPKELLIDLAREYRTNIELANGVDCIYGTGSAKYIGEAIEAFYIS